MIILFLLALMLLSVVLIPVAGYLMRESMYKDTLGHKQAANDPLYSPQSFNSETVSSELAGWVTQAWGDSSQRNPKNTSKHILSYSQANIIDLERRSKSLQKSR